MEIKMSPRTSSWEEGIQALKKLSPATLIAWWKKGDVLVVCPNDHDREGVHGGTYVRKDWTGEHIWSVPFSYKGTECQHQQKDWHWVEVWRFLAEDALRVGEDITKDRASCRYCGHPRNVHNMRSYSEKPCQKEGCNCKNYVPPA